MIARAATAVIVSAATVVATEAQVEETAEISFDAAHHAAAAHLASALALASDLVTSETQGLRERSQVNGNAHGPGVKSPASVNQLSYHFLRFKQLDDFHWLFALEFPTRMPQVGAPLAHLRRFGHVHLGADCLMSTSKQRQSFGANTAWTQASWLLGEARPPVLLYTLALDCIR